MRFCSFGGKTRFHGSNGENIIFTGKYDFSVLAKTQFYHFGKTNEICNFLLNFLNLDILAIWTVQYPDGLVRFCPRANWICPRANWICPFKPI